MLRFLDRERTVAPAGYSRWLVPPAALAVHLSIGQAYSLSVFNIPLTRVLGVDHSTPDDWKFAATIWMFNIAFFFLGLSAALFGTWVERVGPRKAMAASAACFGGGFLVSALGVKLHALALLYAGYGVLGGLGLGLGYIAPVSTLIKWFPDRPGMATGMAIMGFGGGAMVGSPLAVALMDHFRSKTSTGLAEALVVMGVVYTAMMSFGAITVRVPPATASTGTGTPEATGSTAKEAIKTKSFWLMWIVLFTNVTAGIGILGQASPMIQEMFNRTEKAAAGFVGLISLFNLLGRFAWSSLSDRLGRKTTYVIYLGLGMALYAIIPSTQSRGAVGVFVATTCVILSMYGGGFATFPAYLRDLFGTRQVGAIHGRLLTAWSTAALVGPTLVTYARQAQIDHGVPRARAYSTTMYFLVGVLAVGLIANLMIDAPKRTQTKTAPQVQTNVHRADGHPMLRLALYWTTVAVPAAWGVWQVLKKSMALFS